MEPWMMVTDNLWTIYSIGAPNFMHKVFTAIALLGEGGTLMRMGQIGFTVGLFVLVYRIATAVGSLSDLRQVFVAGVIFAAMFGTTTTVKLVGLVPSQGSGSAADIRIVDHVPWGIAAVGAVISGTGVYLTRRMETAFRDPNAIPVTQGGFGRTAEILASVRSLSLDSIPNTPRYSTITSGPCWPICATARCAHVSSKC
ncbi:MAG: conjugal transfer protein TraG N-terminal domain-containing protein [Ahniella sp.]|nr:conjugal transfer protein TraG N-terminal domain-containing protein [Ahniella sp.]